METTKQTSEATTKKPLKDPKGGLTAAGRAAKNKKTGGHLRPGVTKAEKDMTPTEMKRKGSFLRRHYAGKTYPLTDDDGEPTRYALQAHAWGEKVPKTDEDVETLAAKGKKLLEKAKKAAESSE